MELKINFENNPDYHANSINLRTSTYRVMHVLSNMINMQEVIKQFLEVYKELEFNTVEELKRYEGLEKEMEEITNNIRYWQEVLNKKGTP